MSGRFSQSAHILDTGINTGLVNGQPTWYTGNKQTHTVDCLEQSGNQRLASTHLATPNLIEQTLEPMRIVSKIRAHHHRCTALDGVHTPEELIDQSTIPGPAIQFQHSFFHLLQKLD